MATASEQPPQRVLLVAPDNFTPRTRTPWGGTRLAGLKGMTSDTPMVIGESWEVSVEPSFPSVLADGSASLSEVIAGNPSHWLGRDAALGDTSLLVKLLDTEDALSVQIHPSDDYPALAADESGKPESWYVVAAEPGSGIYIGLTDEATPEAMRDCLASNGHLATFLTFVEVAEGDFFVIDAGTAHAIGPGLTLVEPQRVLPGRRGLTYRYWDWNRLYDDEGKPSKDGQPRALDIEPAMDVTRFDAARGTELVDQIRRRAGAADLDAPSEFTALSDAQSPNAIRFAPLSVARVSGTGPLELAGADFMRAITVVAGTITVDGQNIAAGHSGVLAADTKPFNLQCEHAHAIVSAAHAA